MAVEEEVKVFETAGDNREFSLYFGFPSLGAADPFRLFPAFP